MRGFSRPQAWRLTTGVSLILVLGLFALWRFSDCCSANHPRPLQSQEDVDRALAEVGKDLLRLPTGIYVQSLSFVSANDVRLTGRLWQRLPPGETLGPGEDLGVLFADAISPHEDNLVEVYQNVELVDELTAGSKGTLNLWNIQVVLRQNFDYSRYPLDAKLVWVRLWTNDINNTIQLVPDLGAYARPGQDSRMGISESLVPGEWSVRDTFFGFCRIAYKTDFGRMSGIKEPRPSRPELRFYILLQRNFTDAFLVNLVPLFVTIGLLFGLLMTVSRDEKVAERFGFSTLAVFGSCSGLFFISLLGHIQIRREFAGSQIVYIEYFYILSYVLLMAVSVVTFLVTQRETESRNWFLRNSGINVKLLYWPAILTICLALSLSVLTEAPAFSAYDASQHAVGLCNDQTR